MYSDYITKWEEGITGNSYTTGRVDMPAEIAIPNTADNPYKLKVAFRYNGTSATASDKFYIYYSLNGAGGKNSQVTRIAGSKYVRPILYTDSTGLYLGLQCFSADGVLVGTNKVLVNSSPTSTIKVTSMQNASYNYTVFNEIILGDRNVKNTYNTIKKVVQLIPTRKIYNTTRTTANKVTKVFNTKFNVKGVISKKFNTLSTIEEEKKWVLYKEYLKPITSMIKTKIQPTDFIGYTENAPYFMDTAIRTLPTASNRACKIYVKYGTNGNTTGYGVTLTTFAEAEYHRVGIYKDSDGKVVIGLYAYTNEGVYYDKTTYTLSQATPIGIGEVQIYSGGGAIFDVYALVPATEVEEIDDHNIKEYKFSNEANTQGTTPDAEHTLETGLIEYTNAVPNEEIELPFYGIRHTYTSGSPHIKIAYSVSGATEVVKNLYGTASAFRYTKLGLIQKGSYIYLVIYQYDKSKKQLYREEKSIGTASTFSNTTLRILGIYCNTARVLNYKQKIIQRFPITRHYSTSRRATKDYKQNHSTTRQVLAFELIRKSFTTARNVVRGVADKYDVALNIVKGAKNLFDTTRDVKCISKQNFDTNTNIILNKEVKHSTKTTTVKDFKDAYNTSITTIKSMPVKATYNTSSKVVKDSVKKFDTKTSISAHIKNVFDAIFMIGRDVKAIHDTSRNVYAGCNTRYNTIKEVKYSSSEKYNTDRSVELKVKNIYNTVSKTEYKVKTVYDTIKSVYGKIAHNYNTTTEIITEVSKKYNTKVKVENRIVKKFDTVKDVKLEYRKVFDTQRKIIKRAKSKYNTESTVRFFVMARYATQRETDIVAVIKMLLGIHDNSQDAVLKFLVFKAIEDIHASCNLERGELTRAREQSPVRSVMFAEEEVGYYSAASEMGQNRHLQNILIDLVIYYYRMRGMEHLKNESVEGGSWNYIYESIPPQILARLKPYKRMPKLRVF